MKTLTAGGPEGNERLTSATAVILLVLLAIEGITIVLIGRLMWGHLFVGMLLIGPLALKLASTGYRFARYYGGDGSYRRMGPPPLLLRMGASIVVLTSVLIMVSGVILLFAGTGGYANTLLLIHKISFFVWLAFMSLHVLGHLPEIQRLSAVRRCRGARRSALALGPRAGGARALPRTWVGPAAARSRWRWRCFPGSRWRWH